MKFILIVAVVALLLLSSCTSKISKDLLGSPDITPEKQPQKEELPEVVIEESLVNDCPFFSHLKVEYSDKYRSYISVLSEYHALFKTSRDVQGYKIRGGVGAKADIVVYCSKGQEHLHQDTNLIYCSGDSTNSPIFTETFTTNPDGSTKKTQKKITLIFNPDGSFYKTECK